MWHWHEMKAATACAQTHDEPQQVRKTARHVSCQCFPSRATKTMRWRNARRKHAQAGGAHQKDAGTEVKYIFIDKLSIHGNIYTFYFIDKISILKNSDFIAMWTSIRWSPLAGPFAISLFVCHIKNTYKSQRQKTFLFSSAVPQKKREGCRSPSMLLLFFCCLYPLLQLKLMTLWYSSLLSLIFICLCIYLSRQHFSKEIIWSRSSALPLI